MPVVTTCPQHPNAVVDYTDDVFAHAAADHPGMTVQAVSDGLVRRFVSQAHANGRPERRITHCRACNARMEFLVGPDDDPNVPELCEAHRG